MSTANGAPRSARKRINIRLSRDCYKSGDAFLLTLCTKDKLPILTEEPVSSILSGLLQSQMSENNGPMSAYVIMPDHLHMLISSAQDTIQWVAWFKARVTFLLKKAGFQKQIWQKSFHDHGVRSCESIEDILQYMRNNPVKNGLVERSEDWPLKAGC